MGKVVLLMIALFFISSKPLFAEAQPLHGTQIGEFDDYIITWTQSDDWCSISRVEYPKNWDIKSIQLFNDPVMDKEWDPPIKLVIDPLMPKGWDALTVQLVKDLLKSKELEQDKVTYWNFYLTYKVGNNLITQAFVPDLTHAVTLTQQCYVREAISKIVWERAK